MGEDQNSVLAILSADCHVDRHLSGDIKKAGGHVHVELSGDLGWRYKCERHSHVMELTVIYNSTN